ncbi:MAG: protein SCO1/2 [Rhodothermales bacterium]|jgi:protein SCO1/2
MTRFLPLVCALALCACSPETSELPYYRTASLTPEWLNQNEAQAAHEIGDFALVNQDGDSVTGQDLEGQVYVANFFFVRCTAICPTMRSNLGKVQDAFADDPGVKLISHTIDPESDSVSILRGYAALNKIKSGKWHLLTGSHDEIYGLARDSYFAELDDLGTGFLHTENFYLVDGQGHLRGVYNGTLEFDVERLVEDIRVLRHRA